MHRRADARTHTRTHAYTQGCTHARMHTWTDRRTDGHTMHARTHAQTHTRTHARTYARQEMAWTAAARRCTRECNLQLSLNINIPMARRLSSRCPMATAPFVQTYRYLRRACFAVRRAVGPWVFGAMAGCCSERCLSPLTCQLTNRHRHPPMSDWPSLRYGWGTDGHHRCDHRVHGRALPP